MIVGIRGYHLRPCTVPELARLMREQSVPLVRAGATTVPFYGSAAWRAGRDAVLATIETHHTIVLELADAAAALTRP